MTKVMKFGGGCLRDGCAFLKAAEIIVRQKRTAVVVSAVSGVTEQLLAAIGQAKRSEKNIPAILARLTANAPGRHRRTGFARPGKAATAGGDPFPAGPGSQAADRHRLPRRPDPGGQGQAAELTANGWRRGCWPAC